MVQAFTSGAAYYFLRFEGLNTADENKAVIVEVFRFSSDPLKELDLISDTLAKFDVEGSVYPDSTKTGAGESKYYRTLLAK